METAEGLWDASRPASRVSAASRVSSQCPAQHGPVCQFSISCPVPTPHAPIAWSYHLGAWDGVGTARTTQSGRYGPEKLSRAACATELRWGPFLPVPSRGTRRHRWVRASNRHAARAIAGNSRPRGRFPAGETNPPSRIPASGNLVTCVGPTKYQLWQSFNPLQTRVWP